jgi:hypothetical protein
MNVRCLLRALFDCVTNLRLSSKKDSAKKLIANQLNRYIERDVPTLTQSQYLLYNRKSYTYKDSHKTVITSIYYL